MLITLIVSKAPLWQIILVPILIEAMAIYFCLKLGWELGIYVS
jgi:hypothetical protein